MRRPILVAAALVLIGAAALLLRQAAPQEPRLSLPAVERFAPGACRAAADTVRSLARLTHSDDVTALTKQDRAELRRLQDRLVTVRPAAPEDVRQPLEGVIVSLGYLRLRLDSRTAEPQYLRDVEAARALLQQTCIR